MSQSVVWSASSYGRHAEEVQGWRATNADGPVRVDTATEPFALQTVEAND